MIETIIELGLILVAHAAAGIYSSTLKYSKKKTYIIWGSWIALQTALFCYTEIFMTNWSLQFFFGFIFPLVGQYVIFFATTKGKLTQRIFTMLSYSVFFCIVTSPFILVRDALSRLHWSLAVLVQAILLSAVVFYYLRYFCTFCRAASKNINKGWLQLIFVNLIFFITIILSSVFPVKLKGFDDPAFFSFVSLSISILAVYPVIFSNINSMSEAAIKREVEVQNKLLIAQIEAEKAQLAADSQARHDRRHHNLVMLEFANNNDIESVREYLKNLVEGESKLCGEERYCDNLTVNTVLAVYERQAGEKGVSVKISANVSRDINVLTQDLVIVIANLFENAINASAKNKSGKNIDVNIKESSQRLLIKVENPCKANYSFEESDYGVGIRSIIATTNKYDGMYDFSAENGIFSAKISLNLE